MTMTITETERPQAEHRNAYKVFRDIGTRWSDNDIVPVFMRVPRG